MNFCALPFLLLTLLSPAAMADNSPVSKAGKACLECHGSSTPGIVEQWQSSAHAKSGVDCYTCHQAAAGDPATFDHYGYKIAVIVTPNYCGRCHATEVKQFEKSHHAAAAQFIGSLDNMLGEIVEGSTTQSVSAGPGQVGSWSGAPMISSPPPLVVIVGFVVSLNMMVLCSMVPS